MFIYIFTEKTVSYYQQHGLHKPNETPKSTLIAVGGIAKQADDKYVIFETMDIGVLLFMVCILSFAEVGFREIRKKHEYGDPFETDKM